MFGFQLSNIIAGFPKHTQYFVDPPYELLTSQDAENGQVGFSNIIILLIINHMNGVIMN